MKRPIRPRLTNAQRQAIRRGEARRLAARQNLAVEEALERGRTRAREAGALSLNALESLVRNAEFDPVVIKFHTRAVASSWPHPRYVVSRGMATATGERLADGWHAIVHHRDVLVRRLNESKAYNERHGVANSTAASLLHFASNMTSMRQLRPEAVLDYMVIPASTLEGEE